MYHFAAVPPTPDGEKMARALDEAWPRYPSVLDRIRGGAASIVPEAERRLNAATGLLRLDKPVHINLLIYVGGLEDNAFTVAQDGEITTAIPIESSPDTREMLMTHEFTHAVQVAMGSFSGSFQRTIDTIVVTEGLASRVTEALSEPPSSRQHRIHPEYSLHSQALRNGAGRLEFLLSIPLAAA